MRASTTPGPVRVAVAVDLGIAVIYALATLVGVPDGRLGAALVAGEAAALAVVVLTWVFRPFWARWSAWCERLLRDDGDDGAVRDGVALTALPSRRSLVAGVAVFSVLAVVQTLTTSGAGVAFRSIVAAYVVAAALGAAVLAVASDVSSLLAATRPDE